MNLKQKSGRILSVLFALLFLWTAKNAVFGIIPKRPATLVISAAVIAAALFLCRFIVRNEKDLSDKKVLTVYAVCALLSVVFQTAFVLKLGYHPISDMQIVDSAARNFARDGSFENMYSGLENHCHYFDRFPNNWAILMLLSFVYRLDFLIDGSVSDLTAQILNIIAIQTSLLFCFLTAKMLFENKTARIISAVIPVFMPVFYLYAPLFYTDTLSMPFVTAAVYFFLKAERSDERKTFAVNLAVSSVLVGIGYSVKGSAVVIAVAVVMYAFLRISPKRAALSGLCMVISVVVASSAVNALGLSLGISTKQRLHDEKVPLTHWVSMSLVGNGGFDDHEYALTISKKGIENKKAYTIRRIRKHLGDYTPITFAEHLDQKSEYTWSSGKYYATHHLSDCESKRLTYFVKDSHKVTALCDSSQLVLVLLMLASFVGGVFKKKIEPMFFIRLCVFGLALFLLIWETRSRYLINFLPLFVIMAADGLTVIHGLFQRLGGERHKKTD